MRFGVHLLLKKIMYIIRTDCATLENEKKKRDIVTNLDQCDHGNFIIGKRIHYMFRTGHCEPFLIVGVQVFIRK